MYDLRNSPSSLVTVLICAALATIVGCLTSGDQSNLSGVTGSQSSKFPAKQGLNASGLDASATVRTLGETDRDLFALRALAQSIFHACGREQKTLETWLVQPESTLFPLMPVDDSGAVAKLGVHGCCDDETHVASVRTSDSMGGRLYYVTPGGEKLNCRIGDFGVPLPPATARKATSGGPGPVVIDHLKTLPASTHIIYGVAWAFAELPDLATTQAGALRNQLGLVIPPSTVQALQTGYGEPVLFKSQHGDLCLQFQHEQVEYYVLIERYHFEMDQGRRIRLAGIPEESDGIFKSVTIFGSEDPTAVLSQRAFDGGGPSLATWTVVTEGWTEL